jgi:hypothetical protein
MKLILIIIHLLAKLEWHTLYKVTGVNAIEISSNITIAT